MYSKQLRVNFFDADPGGILFFANFYRLAHQVYEEFLSDPSLSRHYFYDDKYLIPLIHSEADYQSPVRPGEIVTINMVASQVRQSSFELTFSFFNEKGNPLAMVKTVQLFVLRESMEKTAIPDEVRKLLLSIAGE